MTRVDAFEANKKETTDRQIILSELPNSRSRDHSTHDPIAKINPVPTDIFANFVLGTPGIRVT